MVCSFIRKCFRLKTFCFPWKILQHSVFDVRTRLSTQWIGNPIGAAADKPAGIWQQILSSTLRKWHLLLWATPPRHWGKPSLIKWLQMASPVWYVLHASVLCKMRYSTRSVFSSKTVWIKVSGCPCIRTWSCCWINTYFDTFSSRTVRQSSHPRRRCPAVFVSSASVEINRCLTRSPLF